MRLLVNSMTFKEIIYSIGKQNLIYITIGIVAFLILYIMFRQMRLKSKRREVVSIENRISAVKSLPIQYRLGRVQNIAKTTLDVQPKYEDFEKRYDSLVSVQRDEISILLNEIDEKLYAGKMFKVSGKIKTLKEKVGTFEADANQLLKEIEEVTEIENIQRLAIIKTKEKYRQMQDLFSTSRYKLESVATSLDEYCDTLDQEFINLENFMNAQQYDEAKKQCEYLDSKLDYFAANVRDMPTYISLASSYIPQEMEKIQNRIVDLKSRGFSLERIDAENKLLGMQEALKSANDLMQSLELEQVGETLNKITADMNDLNNAFETEEVAQGEFNQIWEEIFEQTSTLSINFNAAKKEYDELTKLYVIEDEEMDISNETATLNAILEEMTNLKAIINTNEFSYQEVVEKLKALSSDSDEFELKLKNFFEKKDAMYLAEKRALDELENINIVLLEIKSQIKNKNLPVINESYKDYIADSYKKANEIQFLCKSRPIMINNLTIQVDIARDIIYKLYDNIHNLIVTADMVEEAIIFGNRYRSSFLEVNTELTKAEVLYRNGEYTKALGTAVDIIEKIKPGSYERLVRKNNLAKDPRNIIA